MAENWTESDLERYFSREVKKIPNVECIKISKADRAGIPDRICVGVAVPYGALFIEFKSPKGTGKLSKLQELEIERLKDVGAMVTVCSNRQQADNILRALRGSEDI